MNPETGETLGTQVNTDLVRSFQEIVDAGWANASDGNMEAPCGFFALVNIEPNELTELAWAMEWMDGRSPVPYPGSYIYEVDSDGNRSVTEFYVKYKAVDAYHAKLREFARWDCDQCHYCKREGSLEPASLDGSIKKCVACNKEFDPGEHIFVFQL